MTSAQVIKGSTRRGRIFQDDYIPISDLQREAPKVLKNLDKAKLIMKNNSPHAVIMSVSAYNEMLEDIEELELAILACKRFNESNGKTTSHKDVMKKFGITRDDIEAAKKEVVIE
ncbi:MAG: type II toxin-antitoxin system Phd/YefM family antitoxin [Peptostreptococcaceae bacterium]|nr:type II toxin-antitoxin system Phd/YefM family antitoxin [Peptostreptococcaceae bacterium]